MSNSITKILFAASILCFSFGSVANAITINSVEPIAGGPIVTDGDATVGLSSSSISISGTPAGTAQGGSFLFPVPGLLTTGTLDVSGQAITGGSFTILDIFGGTSFLFGSFLDAEFTANEFDILFSVDGGTASSDFGSLVLFSLASPLFGPGTLGNLPQAPLVDVVPAALTVTSVEAIPVPTPATLALFLPGLLAMFALRTRKGLKRSRAQEI